MDQFDQTRRRVLASGAALLAAGLAPSPSFARQDNIFRIGALNPITGSGGPYGSGMQKIILLVADEINAAGGAGGRKLKVYTADSQTKPEAAALAARKLLDVNKVQAIVGTWASGVTLAVLAQTNIADAILMHCSGASTISKQNVKGLAWRFQATSDRFGRGFYEVVKRRGFKRVATMGVNNASTLSIMEGFNTALGAAGGKVVESVVYQSNLPSYQSELQKVLEAKPDAIVTGFYLYDASIIMREWYQTGQPVIWLAPGFVGVPDLVKAVGPKVVEGMIIIDIMNNVGSKSLARFDRLYKKATGQAPTTYAAMCYDMMMVLGLAIEAAGANASTKQINDKIREVSSSGGTIVTTFAQGKAALKHGKISYEGASSRLNFDALGNTSQDLSVGIVKNGVIVNIGSVHV